MRVLIAVCLCLVCLRSAVAADQPTQQGKSGVNARTLYGYCVEGVKVMDHDTSANLGEANKCLYWLNGFIEGFKVGAFMGSVPDANSSSTLEEQRAEADRKSDQTWKALFGCVSSFSSEVVMRTYVKGMKDNPGLFDQPAGIAIATIFTKAFPC